MPQISLLCFFLEVLIISSYLYLGLLAICKFDVFNASNRKEYMTVWSARKRPYAIHTKRNVQVIFLLSCVS